MRGKKCVCLLLAAVLLGLAAACSLRNEAPSGADATAPPPASAPPAATAEAVSTAEAPAPEDPAANPPEDAPGDTAPRLEYGRAEDAALGSYEYLLLSGLRPHVFAPVGAGSENPDDFLGVTGMMETYGAEYGMAAAINAGIFYDTLSPTVYCYHGKEPDGVVIAGGVVLKSTESLDHSECDILVIDEDGGVGWADYYADADALAAGTGSYYDIYGAAVAGKRIVSAVTGFVPVLVGGENVYDADDALCRGYDNFVDHYTQRAPRQIFGVRADGTYVVLTNFTEWTLSDAAEAAKAQGCVFAYNLDGGDSVETVVAENGTTSTLAVQRPWQNRIPTYLVFTAADTPPVSAAPEAIRAELSGDGVFSPGVSLRELAGALTVTEFLANANGGVSERRIYSAQALAEAGLAHKIIGGGIFAAFAETKKQSVSPNGTLFYTKTESDASRSLLMNGNTRADGKYYDYSTGFTVDTADDLTVPGEKTLRVSYVPGGGLEPLTAEVRITITG